MNQSLSSLILRPFFVSECGDRDKWPAIMWQHDVVVYAGWSFLLRVSVLILSSSDVGHESGLVAVVGWISFEARHDCCAG